MIIILMMMFPLIDSNDSDSNRSVSDISIGDLLEEDGVLVYEQFNKQRKIERSLETHESNTYLNLL